MYVWNMTDDQRWDEIFNLAKRTERTLWGPARSCQHLRDKTIEEASYATVLFNQIEDDELVDSARPYLQTLIDRAKRIDVALTERLAFSAV